MKKVFIAMMLVMTIISGLFNVCAEDNTLTVLSNAYSSRVVVKGHLDTGYAGKPLTLLMIKDKEGTEEILDDDIGYIDDGIVEADGNYKFEFSFNGNTNDYYVKVNQGDNNVTSSIKKCIAMDELIIVDLQMTAKENSVDLFAEIENVFSLDNLTYNIILAFYNEGRQMLNVISRNQELSGNKAEENMSHDVPVGTSIIKAFIWSNSEKMIPICKPEEFSYETINNYSILFPGHTNKVITFSYDDGSSHDERLVGIFNDNGLKGTFNLCGANQNSLARYAGHEVSNHTSSHPRMYVTSPDDPKYGDEYVTYDECIESIDTAYASITNIFGVGAVKGFVWPYREPVDRDDYLDILNYVKDNYLYARGVNSSLNFNIPDNWYDWKPTCYQEVMMSYVDDFLADSKNNELKLFNIWGHSVDYETNDSWGNIETLAAMMKGRNDVWKATYIEIYNYIEATRMLEIGDKSIYNPSDIDVYAKVNGNNVVIPAKDSISGKR